MKTLIVKIFQKLLCVLGITSPSLKIFGYDDKSVNKSLRTKISQDNPLEEE